MFPMSRIHRRLHRNVRTRQRASPGLFPRRTGRQQLVDQIHAFLPRSEVLQRAFVAFPPVHCCSPTSRLPEMSSSHVENLRRCLHGASCRTDDASASANCATYYALLSRGAIRTALPIPFSASDALPSHCSWIAFEILFRSNDRPARELKWSLVIPTLLRMPDRLSALAQIFFLRKNQLQRRPADVAVVFGARTYADGSPSMALADRVRTGCDLYRRGLVKFRSIFLRRSRRRSRFHETDTMRAAGALKWGVLRRSIVQVDRAGLNTRATLENVSSATRRLAAKMASSANPGSPSAIFIICREIKLESQRLGMDSRTVPANRKLHADKNAAPRRRAKSRRSVAILFVAARLIRS